MASDGTDSFLARQVRGHLESLKAAGVEFLPLPVQEQPLAASRDAKPQAAIQPEPRLQEEPRPPASVGGDLFAPSPTPTDSPDARRELAVLAQSITGCDRCPELFSTRTQTVFGVGPVNPDICFVGEAPGADEDKQGEPFVGRAGQLLNQIIEKGLGYRRDQVYICNTIKCRPPNNRDPSPNELSNCREYFDRQIALVNPKYLVCLGRVAAQAVLNTTTGINKLRGQIHRLGNIPVICTFHPAYLLRDVSKKQDCWEDMKFLLRTMGRPIPART